LRRLLDLQIGRLGALQDPPNANADMAIDRSQAGSVGDQAAGLDDPAPLAVRGGRAPPSARRPTAAPTRGALLDDLVDMGVSTL
jgi:hypothetical protein